MQEDALLIRRAQKGDAQAFETLVAPYEKKIYALCLRMLGNREDALDCAQEAMLRIWRAMGTYKKQASFSTWSYRIATNTCLDLLRRKKVRPSISLDGLAEAGYLPADSQTGPEAMAESSARKQALERGIASLPEDLRAAIVLRDIQGFSYEEVAEVLRTPLGTVKSRINRAREKLRKLLYPDGELFAAEAVYTNERRKDA